MVSSFVRVGGDRDDGDRIFQAVSGRYARILIMSHHSGLVWGFALEVGTRADDCNPSYALTPAFYPFR